MRVLIELGEGDLVTAAEALGASRDYVKAILEAAERSPKGAEIEERITLLARANSLERARQALVRFKEAVVISAANEEIAS